MGAKETIRGVFLKIALKMGFELKEKDYPESKAVSYYDNGLNPIAIGANVISTITLDDSTIEIKGENARSSAMAEIAEYYQNNIRASAVEISAGTGDCLLRPYTDGKRIGISIITNSDFAVIDSVGDFIKSLVIHLDSYTDSNGQSYDLFELQCLKQSRGTNYVCIKRMAYRAKSQQIKLSDTQWANMEEEQNIPSEQLLLGRIKCPAVNRKAPNSVNGVPITFGCENIVDEIRRKYIQYNKEFDKKQAKIFADRTMFAGGDNGEGTYKLPDNDVYQFVTGDRGGVKELIDAYSPEIRDESFKNAADFNFSVLEMCCGFSRGIYTAPETAFATATEMKNSLKKTFAFVKKFRNSIESGENQLLGAVNIIMNLNGITPMGDYEVYYDWSYDYIEETRERFNQLLQMNSIGAVDSAEVRAWGMNEDIETARTEVMKISAERQETDDITDE